MAGPIVDIPVHVCRVRRCRTIWLADPNIWENVEVCPKCGGIGTHLTDHDFDISGKGLDSDGYTPPPLIPTRIRFVTIEQPNCLELNLEILSGTVNEGGVSSFWNEDFSACPT